MSRTDPSMIVYAGTNGAGKSTITKFYPRQVEVVIDPDSIARRMNPENPEKVSLQAGKLAIQKVNQLILERSSFSIETTLGGKNALRQIEKAKEAGYNVEMHYVGLRSVEDHVQRVKQRVLGGGHYIPEKDIRRRFNTSLENLKTAAQHVDRLTIWDNSHFPKSMVTIEKGLMFEREQLPQWFTERYQDITKNYARVPMYPELQKAMDQQWSQVNWTVNRIKQLESEDNQNPQLKELRSKHSELQANVTKLCKLLEMHPDRDASLEIDRGLNR
ncbi:hypothetical protein J6TS7_32140 [Paenibacillus dendritiformis]|uniref:zeta toxin family protein n=1 Tax=Paenibacillus TaxID=44249 RepID=UPI001B148069|nr:zeta toxin family protein [Paenibacillus dendritiformis]GIO79604.1 hypothetical protein J6TS7_32140 [Paenibacillus dendritiformis]